MSSAKIKILFRNRSMEVGGSESVLINIFEILDYNKYELILLLNYRQGEFLNRIPKEVRVESIGDGISSFSKNIILSKFQKIIRRLKYSFFQKYPDPFYKKYYLYDCDYEVAFSHYMLEDVYNSPNKKSKKIYWIHGDFTNSNLSKSRDKKLINIMCALDKGVFVSKHGKDIIEKHWNVKLKNSQVINNPFDIEAIRNLAYDEIEDKFCNIDFISVGRLYLMKGFKDLLMAHQRLIAENYKIKTLIIGDGSQKEELETLIESYNLQDSFYLYGFSNNPIKYINNSRFFVLPSYSESYPMVIGEALILNKPVLSTNVGGIAEMVSDNVNGLLFNPGKDNLFNYMKLMLDNSDKELNFRNHNSRKEFADRNVKIYKQLNNLFQ